MLVNDGPKSSVARFRVVLLSGAHPAAVERLTRRMTGEVEAADVVGILYEQRRPKTIGPRIKSFARSLGRKGFARYALKRTACGGLDALIRLGDTLLRFAHACPPDPNGSLPSSPADLARYCASRGIPFHHTADIHDAASLAFVRDARAQLGVVFGTSILQPALFALPEHGCINVHKRKVPRYRGGGPIGLWEMLDGERELGVTVHRVAAAVDMGAVVVSNTFPIERFDTLTSVGLKADVIGNDLIVEAVRRFTTGTVHDAPQTGPGRTYRSPAPEVLAQLERQLASARDRYRADTGRSIVKLLARSLVPLPFAVARNWWRRWTGSFPIVVLYHHVVTDRLHCEGIPTEQYLRHVEYLRRHYRIVNLQTAVEMMASGRVRQPTIALTLDDGYGDNFLGLRAIVEATGVPVTLFVSTTHVADGSPFAHDITWGHFGFRALTPDQVVFLSRHGFEIGSHTRTHFDCASRDRSRLTSEIAGSRTDLQEWLGTPPKFFAFPWGQPANMSEPAVNVARAAYPHICSAAGGVNRPGQDCWHLKRAVHPNHMWELELQLQSLLEFDTGRDPLALQGRPSGPAADAPHQLRI